MPEVGAFRSPGRPGGGWAAHMQRDRHVEAVEPDDGRDPRALRQIMPEGSDIDPRRAVAEPVDVAGFDAHAGSRGPRLTYRAAAASLSKTPTPAAYPLRSSFIGHALDTKSGTDRRASLVADPRPG